MQPARSIDNEHVDPAVSRRLHRIENDARRIAAFGSAHKRHAQPVCPDGELGDGGGAEGVAGRQHHAVILLLEQVCELGDGCGLARAIDADHQHHLRAREGGNLERLGDRAQDRGNFLGHGLPDRLLIGAAFEAFARQSLADAGSGAGAEVGQDQCILKLVELRLIQPGHADNAGEVFGQALRGFAETAEQALRPAVAAHASKPSAMRVGVIVTSSPASVPGRS